MTFCKLCIASSSLVTSVIINYCRVSFCFSWCSMLAAPTPVKTKPCVYRVAVSLCWVSHDDHQYTTTPTPYFFLGLIRFFSFCIEHHLSSFFHAKKYYHFVFSPITKKIKNPMMLKIDFRDKIQVL